MEKSIRLKHQQMHKTLDQLLSTEFCANQVHFKLHLVTPFFYPEEWHRHGFSNQTSKAVFWDTGDGQGQNQDQLPPGQTWKSRFSRDTRLVMGSIGPASTGFRAPHLNFNIFTAYLIETSTWKREQRHSGSTWLADSKQKIWIRGDVI